MLCLRLHHAVDAAAVLSSLLRSGTVHEHSTACLPVGLLVTFGLLGLFHFGAIKNNAAVNSRVPVLWCKNTHSSTR